MKRILFVLAAVSCGLSTQVFAGNHGKVDQEPVVARTLDRFNKDINRMYKQMQPGGLYEYVSPTEKYRVEHDVQIMRKLLQARESKNDMPDSEKVALFNAQAEINGILRHNDKNRLVCEQTAPTGSHIKITRCSTFGERMARQRSDRRSVVERRYHKKVDQRAIHTGP